MTATVRLAEPGESFDVVNAPGECILAHAPPDDLAMFFLLPGGKYARVQVDCHAFDLVLDDVHEKLVASAADDYEKAQTKFQSTIAVTEGAIADGATAEETPPLPAPTEPDPVPAPTPETSEPAVPAAADEDDEDDQETPPGP